MSKKTEKPKKQPAEQDGKEEKQPRKPSVPELVRGMKDILPGEVPYWEWIMLEAASASRDYGFTWTATPIVEPASLFIRAIGKQTDIVLKELYRFTDQGGEDLVLRPEATAGVIRSYLNHGLWNQPQPVKLWYMGPMFRHDRPQAGRYRQFHQWGLETIGDEKPIVDAELMIIARNFLSVLGLPVTMQVNSLGSPESRAAYCEKLLEYYRARRSQLCDDCKSRLSRNPLRLLDCKNENCAALRTEAPQLIDAIDDDSKNHFMQVLEFLDDIEVPYVLNPYLVRGLDYYNRTVFEITLAGEDEARQAALGGGGRYDGLAETLGGRPTPAAGLALGIERIILAMKSLDIQPKEVWKPKIFLAQLGEQAKRQGLRIFEECRKYGLAVAASFSKDSLKGQLETAGKLGIAYTLILGQKEVLDGTIIIRDMDSGMQEIVDQRKLIQEIKKKLASISDGARISKPKDAEEKKLEDEIEEMSVGDFDSASHEEEQPPPSSNH